MELNTITPEGRALLAIIGRVRCNVIISGGTGSGRTTLLNCMTASIDGGERIVTCEDSAELQLQQPHVVRLETRPANLEGEGEVTMRDLVKNSCVCARTVSLWARCAVRRLSTFCRP